MTRANSCNCVVLNFSVFCTLRNNAFIYYLKIFGLESTQNSNKSREKNS